jgi:hypothetical protein
MKKKTSPSHVSVVVAPLGLRGKVKVDHLKQAAVESMGYDSAQMSSYSSSSSQRGGGKLSSTATSDGAGNNGATIDSNVIPSSSSYTDNNALPSGSGGGSRLRRGTASSTAASSSSLSTPQLRSLFSSAALSNSVLSQASQSQVDSPINTNNDQASSSSSSSSSQESENELAEWVNNLNITDTVRCFDRKDMLKQKKAHWDFVLVFCV